MDGQVCATVIGEITGKVASKVINTISRRQSVDEKLQRLEMLVIKLRGTVEVSEMLGTETVSLLQWRDKLKEAASKGNQVLLSFQRRAADGGMAAAEGSEEHQGGGRSVILVRNILLAMDRGVRKAATALLSYSECAASYTRNTLVGMARGVRSATTAFLSCSEGVVKLNSTVDKLEKTCANIGEFISLHHAEASRAKVVCSPANGNRRAGGNEISTGLQDSIESGGVNGNGKKNESNKKNQQRGQAAVMLKGSLEEQPAVMSMAARRLQDALAEISRAVAEADHQGLTNLEWLAELADVLREDRRVGSETIGIGREKENKAARQEAVQQLRTSDAAASEEEIEAGFNEKLQRLEMLVVKLRSTVEVSLRLGAKATPLLQWRDKLCEAASKGDSVLLNFKRRVMRVCPAAADAINEHMGGGKTGTMFFVRKALFGMGGGIQKSSTATTTLLLAGEGSIELNSTVGRLEKVCAEDVEDFIRLLQVETSQVEVMDMPMKRKKLELKRKLELTEDINIAENVIPQDISVSREDVRGRRRRFVLSSSSGEEDSNDCSKQRRTRRKLIDLYSSSSSSIKQDEAEVRDEDGSRSRRSTGLLSSSTSSSQEGEDSRSTRTRRRLSGLFSSSSSSFSSSSPFSLSLLPSPVSLSSSPLPSLSSQTSEEEFMAMVRFGDMLAEINKAVEMAESRNLTGLEWLAEWAYVLRDARQRSHTINLNGGEQEVEGICNAANILETLALDVECFISLVLLCPSIPTTKTISNGVPCLHNQQSELPDVTNVVSQRDTRLLAIGNSFSDAVNIIRTPKELKLFPVVPDISNRHKE